MLANLRKLRNEAGISQSRLGKEIGVTQQAINKYENHNVEPDIYTLKLLAAYFNTSIDYITGYSDDKNSDSSPLISQREQHLIQSFRRLNNQQRESIELIIKNYLSQISL